MKWVTFTCVLFLLSSAYSRGVFRRDAPKSELADRYKDLGEEIFKGLMLVDFSQFLRKSTLDQIRKLTNDTTELAKVCALDELAEHCGKPLRAIFGDKLCSVTSLGDMANCCEKQEPERYQCFLKHKDDELDFPPFGPIDPGTTCTAFQQYEQKLLGTYIYEIARRYPYIYAPELLYYTQEYKGILTECCQGANPDARLVPKMAALWNKVQTSAYKEEFKCSLLQNKKESALRDWFVARLTKKFPNADFMMISKLATDLTKVHKECCQGDLLECADDRVDLAKYMCENQASISTKLAGCCNKPVLEKSHCLAELAGDDSAAHLAKPHADFVDNADVCKSYTEAKNDYLDKFLYNVSRGHPEFPASLLLRLTKEHEANLDGCCGTDGANACNSKVFDELKLLVDKPKELTKKDCEAFENLGEYGFQNMLLVIYTKKIPQVSTPTLVELSRQFGIVGSMCCKLPESQRMACVEDHLSLILNRFCVAHEKTPVSDSATKCCKEFFVNTLPCFSALAFDEAYVPKEFNAETFTFHADVCTLPEHQQQVKKQIALVELLKHKPKATEEQLKTVMGNFSAFLQKCCAADDKAACFAEEGPKLVASSQATLA